MDIDVPVSFNEASRSLIPVIRRTSEPAHALAAEKRDPSNRLIRRVFAPFLQEMLCLDLPDLRMFVNKGHLEAWGVKDEEDAFGAAHETLAESASQGLTFRDEWKLWHLDAPDGSASSRLALPGWLGAFDGDVPGKPIAAMPSPGVLLVGGMEDDEQLAQLLEFAEEGFKRGGNPISPALYTVGPGGMTVPLHLSPVARRHHKGEGAHRLLAAFEYTRQQEVMDEDSEVSAQIADIQMVRHRGTGEAYTLCTWAAGEGELWLPRTDRIRVVFDDGPLVLRWDSVRRSARGHLEELNTDPPRYRASWPGARVLARLQAAARTEAREAGD
jgi:hypothetical protein